MTSPTSYTIVKSLSTKLNISSLKNKQETPKVNESAARVTRELILKLVDVRLICGATRLAKAIPKYKSPNVRTTGALIFNASANAEPSAEVNVVAKRSSSNGAHDGVSANSCKKPSKKSSIPPHNAKIKRATSV